MVPYAIFKWFSCEVERIPSINIFCAKILYHIQIIFNLNIIALHILILLIRVCNALFEGLTLVLVGRNLRITDGLYT